MTAAEKRATIRRWLDTALEAIDPRMLVATALRGRDTASTVIAIGKASVGMTWGAFDALGAINGICVTNKADEVAHGIDLIVGDHPVPEQRSLNAGKRVLDLAASTDEPILALISGGGSALCELPLPGIDPQFLMTVNRILLGAGAPISEVNLIRRHLSAIKCGGVVRAADQAIETLVISDVAGGGPHLVASGPTIPSRADPHRAEQLMARYGIPLDDAIRSTMNQAAGHDVTAGPVTVLADGRTAGEALATRALEDGVPARLQDGWITGDVDEELRDVLDRSGPGVTVCVGEPTLEVRGNGVGGRNTHTSLIAAGLIAQTNTVFAAFASDGVDGRTDAAGAIVDGETIARGGNATSALANNDSATFLESTGDLIHTGPTGTNVSDLWVIWKD